MKWRRRWLPLWSRPEDTLVSAVTLSLEEMIRLKAEAKGFGLKPRQPLQSLLAGRHASRLRGRGLQFSELRGYRPGDDIRTIDWRATARRGRTQVRLYEEERERQVLLVVDQRSPMFFGSHRCMKSVAAAEAAALAAWRTTAGGDRVGGWVIGTDGVCRVRPRRGGSGCLRLLGELAGANARLAEGGDKGPEPEFNAVLEEVAAAVPHDALIVLISDLDGADESTSRWITRLQAHNDLLVAGIYDPLGAALRGAPGMRALTRDGLQPVPSGAGFEERFAKEFRLQVDHWRSVFRDLRIPLLMLGTDRPVVHQIREALGGPVHG